MIIIGLTSYLTTNTSFFFSTAGVVHAPRMNLHTTLDEYMDFQEEKIFSDENTKLEGCCFGPIDKKEANRSK